MSFSTRPNNNNPVKGHVLKTGYIKEGQTTKGMRYFVVRYCDNCKHYNVLDLRYEINENLKVLDGKKYKKRLANECPKAEVVK